MNAKRPMRFTTFMRDMLRVTLTRGQTVLCKVAFDGDDPIDLPDDERRLAAVLFDRPDDGKYVERVPPAARRIQAHTLGRESGKSTMLAGLGIYAMQMVDLSRVGPASPTPTFVAFGADKSGALLLPQIASELVLNSPKLRAFYKGPTDNGFAMHRMQPDGTKGRIVEFGAFALSRSGGAVRGRPYLGLVFDEAEHVYSDLDGAYVKTDRTNYRALRPRLLRGYGAHAVFISTPWPSPTLMAELREKNLGNPKTALCSIGGTLLMRDNDPEIAAAIAEERAEDPANTARERDCDITAMSNPHAFFDEHAIDDCTDAGRAMARPSLGGVRFGALDAGFRSDASALVVVSRYGDAYFVDEVDEVRPEPKKPLVPSEVFRRFGTKARALGLDRLAVDSFYVESAREHLGKHGIGIIEVPAGVTGKIAQYMAAKTIINERRVYMSKQHQRLIVQLKSILQRPTQGGSLQIFAPRKGGGGGHADTASALVAALWLADARPGLVDMETLERAFCDDVKPLFAGAG